MSTKTTLAERDLAFPDGSGLQLTLVPCHLTSSGEETAARADQGRADQGRADQGRADQGRADQARTLTRPEGATLPHQFAILLAEGLTGVRPVRQLTPWLSKRGSAHLHRLMPLFSGGHQPRVLRVLTARPAPDAVEMTVIVVIGHRTRALAVRLEQGTRHGTNPERWLCTDIEAA